MTICYLVCLPPLIPSLTRHVLLCIYPRVACFAPSGVHNLHSIHDLRTVATRDHTICLTGKIGPLSLCAKSTVFRGVHVGANYFGTDSTIVLLADP